MSTMTESTTRVAEAQAKLIDQFKAHTNIDAIVKALAQQSQELEAAAFEVLLDTLLATAVGEQLDGIGRVLTVERAGRNDTDYRTRLLAQVLLNKSSGAIPEIVALATALGVTDLTLNEVFPAKMDLISDDLLLGGTEIGATMIKSKAAGVGLTFTWHESLIPFRFGVAGQGFDLGELGEIVAA